jgi:hypothetical protein
VRARSPVGGRAAARLLAAVLVPLAIYWLTLAPSITWRNGGIDSGEVVAGAAALGILHPPGYALFVAIAHLALRSLPELEPARAVNLLCALLAATAAGVVFLTVRAFLRREPGAADPATADAAALAATAGAALGPVWWQHANLATPHALNILFAALLVGAAVAALERGLSRRQAALSGLLIGLAATQHLTLLAIPASAALVLLAAGRRPAPPLTAERRQAPPPAEPCPAPLLVAVGGAAGATWLIAAALVGLLPWAALPALAVAEPAHVWGDPTDLGGWLDLVLARQYREYVGQLSPAGLLYRLALAIWTIARELGPIGFLAALAGGALAWDARRRYLRLALALAAVDVAFFALYAARDVESYLLPVCVVLAPAAGLGIARAAQALADARPWLSAPGLARAAAAAALLFGLAAGWRAADLSEDREAADYARGALAEAPANALLLTETDRHTFALWYGSTALRLRPDVAVVDRWMLGLPWYRRHVQRRYPDLRIPADGQLSGQLLASGAVTDRPVAVTDADGGWQTPVERGRLIHRLTRVGPEGR